MILEWNYTSDRHPTDLYLWAWAQVPGGEYLIEANSPMPGDFRIWFCRRGTPDVFVGQAKSSQEALQLADSDQVMGVKR
jgi:hypothetical protein